MGDDEENFNWTEEDKRKTMKILYVGMAFILGWLVFLLSHLGIINF